MADRIAYVPWTRASGGGNQYVAKVQQWNDHTDSTHGKHTYDLVFHGDADAKQTIRGIGWGHRIYIKGHGGPGDHYIYGDGDAMLKYDEVAERLISDGLQKRWAGVIVCDNCYSAVPKVGSQAFARKFADKMRMKGYLMISFIGYFGPVDSYYNQGEGLMGKPSKYEHRYVTVFGGEVKSKWAQIHL
jgi:hypothetical protein